MNKIHFPLQIVAVCLALVFVLIINIWAFWGGNQPIFYLVISVAVAFLGFVSLAISGSRDALLHKAGVRIWNFALQTPLRSALSIIVLVILVVTSGRFANEAKNRWLTILLSFPGDEIEEEVVTVEVRTSQRDVSSLTTSTNRIMIKLPSSEIAETIALRATSDRFHTAGWIEHKGGRVAHLKLVPRSNPADLVIAMESIRQAVPLSAENPTFDGKLVYCEVVRFRLKASHDLKSDAQITIKSLTVEATPVAISDQISRRLAYRIDANKLPTYGVVDMDTYAVTLERHGISANYVIDKDNVVQVDPSNFFFREGTLTSFQIEPSGGDSVYLSEMVLEAASEGLFKARVKIEYDVAGESRTGETLWLYVFYL